jgi:hypothetical protein
MNKKHDKQKKVYRLALYGLPNSGKTCILAALAMPRDPHPLRYNCTWRKIDLSNCRKKAEAKNLKDSKEWMEKCIKKLNQQEVPEANSNSQGQLVFQYKFTDANNQTVYYIELIDYSGELIDPDLTSNKLKKNLLTRFAEMDGILVLAEAAYQKQLEDVKNDQKKSYEQSHRNLYKLRQAFSLLCDEKQDGGAALDIPVALLINKWDRYSAIEYDHPVNEQKKLKDFLNATDKPPHKGLYDELYSLITDGNFKAFPVSAFGMTKSTSVELPKQTNPLKSFGLEDAFIWIAERRDAIDVQHYKNNATKNLKPCRRQVGLELLKRVPANSELAKQVEKTLSRCRKLQIYWWRATIITLLIILLSVETIFDTINYNKHTVAIENLRVTYTQLEKAEQWLSKYVASPAFRHVVLRIYFNQEQAQTILTKLQSGRENILWQHIKDALKTNVIIAGELASKYLKYYPYGPHAQKAQDIIRRAKIYKLQQKDKDALRDIAVQVSKHIKDKKQLETLLEKLRKLPLHPQVETKEMRQKRESLELQIVKFIKELEWEEFLISYNNNMHSRNFLIVAQLLMNYDHQADARLNRLKEEFKLTVVKELEKHVQASMKENRLDDAQKLLDQYDKFPEELKTHTGKKKINEWLYKINEIEDKTSYEAIRNYKDIEHVNKYLQYAPLQTMKHEVEVYQNYLNKIDPNSKLKLQLQLAQIIWTDKADQDNNNRVTVYLDNKKIIHQNDIVSDWLKPTEIIGTSASFSAKPSDKIRIRISIVEEDFICPDHNNGEGIVNNKSISKLANGYYLKLKNSDGITGTTYIKLLGYPKAPNLPAWHGIR